MQSYLLCTLALLTFPSVLAIRCFVCTPEPSIHACALPEHRNVADCDGVQDVPPVPGMKYDACVRVSSELVYFGGQTLSLNDMNCAIKDWCHQLKGAACNATNYKSVGITLRKCEVSCYSEDMCNASKAASFISTFLSMAVFFAVGFFVHC